MSYLEELLPEFRNGAKIRMNNWPKSFYYELRNEKVYNQDGYRIEKFSDQALFKNVWEFYKDPEPDWQYIIDDRCLCWFWDDNFNWAICGTLGKIEKGAEYRFIMFDDSGNRSPYKQCRPVRSDEVTFYEDKKDEN